MSYLEIYNNLGYFIHPIVVEHFELLQLQLTVIHVCKTLEFLTFLTRWHKDLSYLVSRVLRLSNVSLGEFWNIHQPSQPGQPSQPSQPTIHTGVSSEQRGQSWQEMTTMNTSRLGIYFHIFILYIIYNVTMYWTSWTARRGDSKAHILNKKF